MRKRCQSSHQQSEETPSKTHKLSNNSTNSPNSSEIMDTRVRQEVETTVDSRLQSHMIQKYEEEIRRLQTVVAEKDEQILKLSRENAELATKLHVQESVIGTFQMRLDKVDALVSVHDKAIVSVKDNIQGITYRLANLPLEPKDGRKQLQQMPMPGFPPQPTRQQFPPQMVNTAPSEPVSIALLGDATFKYIDEEHLFNKMAKCNKVTVNSIDEAKAVIPDMLAEQPTCLVVHLGTRDIEYSNSDICAHKMQECVRLCKELASDTHICISLLLPRGDSEPNKVKAQLFNFKVQELLAHEGVQFIIHSEMEKDGRLITKYYQPDFININGLDGSRKLAAHLKHGIRRAVPSLQPQPAQGQF